jgi:hypothetical protein
MKRCESISNRSRQIISEQVVAISAMRSSNTKAVMGQLEQPGSQANLLRECDEGTLALRMCPARRGSNRAGRLEPTINMSISVLHRRYGVGHERRVPHALSPAGAHERRALPRPVLRE